VRTIDWVDDAVVIVDQTALPHELRTVRLTDVDELVEAIRRLAVRGAPALGAAGALGVLLAVREGHRQGWTDDQVARAVHRVRCARPTAVNLAWGVERVLARLPEGQEAVEQEARAVLDEDAAVNRSIAERGADLVAELCRSSTRGDPDAGVRLHTHCNTGALACVECGTALGVVRTLHELGLLARVYADETRPLLQGSRLTAWELVDAVVVGADRIAANGDVINKIGTYPLALAAGRAGVPFVVAAPESTVDPTTPDGSHVEIEDRGGDEVLAWDGRSVAPPGARAINPAFDVTPADLVTAIVTERRIVRPAAGERPG
jgi:methylthioribose-1-phosphate isomerase